LSPTSRRAKPVEVSDRASATSRASRPVELVGRDVVDVPDHLEASREDFGGELAGAVELQIGVLTRGERGVEEEVEHRVKALPAAG
jgi:hypothetical protein